MLLQVTDYRRCQNVVRASVAHLAIVLYANPWQLGNKQ